jgi:hypothetical protein
MCEINWKRQAPAGHGRRGFILLSTAMLGLGLFGFLGLSIDAGYMYWVKERMQTAADSAARAGALEAMGNRTANIVPAARMDAMINGFAHGQRAVTVTVRHPPSSGRYASHPQAVEAVIEQRVPTFFLSLLGAAAGTVRARAVARPGSSGSCVFVLDPSASSAMRATGTTSVSVNCGITVNSSSPSGLVTSGSACVSASYIEVAGGFSNSSNCPPTPTPVTGVGAAADPLSHVPAPAFGSCDHNNFRANDNQNPVILSPGVYCGGIRVNAQTQVQLQPGLYVLNGGGLTMTGQGSLRGSGVTFYNTGGPGRPYAPIDLSGGSMIDLSAPTSGTYEGILFFQDRNIVSSHPNDLTGNSNARYQGALYFPTTELKYRGGAGGVAQYTIVVARILDFVGNSTFRNDYSSLANGSPIRDGAILGE